MPKKRAKKWAPPQEPEERAKALEGGDLVVAPWMRQCLLECCEPLSVQREDWLAKGCPGAENGDRDGQTVARFCRPGPHRNYPSSSCNKVFITPIGPSADGPAPEALVDCLRAHFGWSARCTSRSRSRACRWTRTVRGSERSSRPTAATTRFTNAGERTAHAS